MVWHIDLMLCMWEFVELNVQCNKRIVTLTVWLKLHTCYTDIWDKNLKTFFLTIHVRIFNVFIKLSCSYNNKYWHYLFETHHDIVCNYLMILSVTHCGVKTSRLARSNSSYITSMWRYGLHSCSNHCCGVSRCGFLGAGATVFSLCTI